MNKEEILKKSRNENKNKDLAELELLRHAGNIAGRVGACFCVLLSVIALHVSGILIYSPWIIYFSILGTHSAIKYCKIRRVSDLVLALMYVVICVLCFIFFVFRLLEMGK